MTVQCMDCKKVLSEKCPRCGNKAMAYWESIGGKLTRRFICTGVLCALGFDAGEGGVSHGICEPCVNNRLAAARVDDACKG